MSSLLMHFSAQPFPPKNVLSLHPKKLNDTCQNVLGQQISPVTHLPPRNALRGASLTLIGTSVRTMSTSTYPQNDWQPSKDEGGHKVVQSEIY